GATHALDHRLATELAFCTYFTSHAGHFRRKRPELIHHRVDGISQLKELALHVDRDLFRQVAIGHGRRHRRDVTYLPGKITGHQVHVVRQILPCTGYTLHSSLAAQL